MNEEENVAGEKPTAGPHLICEETRRVEHLHMGYDGILPCHPIAPFRRRRDPVPPNLVEPGPNRTGEFSPSQDRAAKQSRNNRKKKGVRSRHQPNRVVVRGLWLTCPRPFLSSPSWFPQRKLLPDSRRTRGLPPDLVEPDPNRGCESVGSGRKTSQECKNGRKARRETENMVRREPASPRGFLAKYPRFMTDYR